MNVTKRLSELRGRGVAVSYAGGTTVIDCRIAWVETDFHSGQTTTTLVLDATIGIRSADDENVTTRITVTERAENGLTLFGMTAPPHRSIPLQIDQASAASVKLTLDG
ncbi:MAG: hypothetical protein PHT12_03785 [Patescibacteria group bacterium]|nr:hypothetical protein [Patescibacteria group bacterium]